MSYSPRCVARIDAAHAWIALRDAPIVISRARCFSSNAARAAAPSGGDLRGAVHAERYDGYDDALRSATRGRGARRGAGM